VTAGSDEDLLVAVVDEVIYWLDAEGEVPVSVAVRRVGEGGVDLVLPLATVSATLRHSPAPSAAAATCVTSLYASGSLPPARADVPRTCDQGNQGHRLPL
jgi:hypothetical protein